MWVFWPFSQHFLSTFPASAVCVCMCVCTTYNAAMLDDLVKSTTTIYTFVCMCKPFDIKNLSLLETYDPQMLNNQNNKNRNRNKQQQEQQQPVCRVARYSTWQQYNKEETKQI